MTSTTDANIPGIKIQDDDRIDSDIPCWSCDYNLRSLALDAACPECGTPVQVSLEHYDGRRTRPFSLHTLHPVSRTLGLLYGCIGPALVVVVAAFAPMDPINVEWQSGEIQDYIGLMLAGRAMWAFYPFLIWAYLAYAAVIIRPIVVGRTWWVRTGLWLGCILGLQYQLVIVGNLFGITVQALAAILIGVLPIGAIAAVTWNAWAKDASRKPRAHRKRSYGRNSAYVWGTLGFLTIAGILTQGLILVPILFAGPYLMLLCMMPALCRLYRTDFDQPTERSKPIPIAATSGAYFAAWPIAISQAQIVYSSLPTTPPGCYICTASAWGHPWLTRAKPVQFPDGQIIMVTSQMRILKAAEYKIQKYLPTSHRWLRMIYDRLGPIIARQIRSPWLADISFCLLAPIAFLAWLVLLLTGQSQAIDKAYQGDSASA